MNCSVKELFNTAHGSPIIDSFMVMGADNDLIISLPMPHIHSMGARQMTMDIQAEMVH
ncbi:MAG: hypothetical protein IPP25_15015 [Saprospiraceae bacterium]|nr:hypothetical protein [Candidatus Opimibacter skivensis]